MTPAVSVVVPAHDEARVLPRLLGALAEDPVPEDFQVVVVCNGCRDDTADVARRWRGVEVLEIHEASKAAALVAGDGVARHPNRAYVDADVVISRADVQTLAGALSPEVHAVSAGRSLDLSRSSWPVRWYYDVWSRLPQVEGGIFARGVVVVSAEGHRRVQSLPRVMSDDLAMAELFAPGERTVVSGTRVEVRAPRTLADLLRRRVRVATGVAELDERGLRGDSARTSVRTLVGIGLGSPHLLPKLVLFVAVALVVRRRAGRHVRERDFTTWHRDESSRT